VLISLNPIHQTHNKAFKWNKNSGFRFATHFNPLFLSA
jgi:hypothetical protein